MAGIISPTTADALNFGNGATGLAAGTVTVSGTVNANSLTFASGSGAIILSGGTINLGGTTPTITVNNTTNTIDSIISGFAGLTKAGTGTLILTGANTYTGTTTIQRGTMQLSGASGALASTSIALNGGTFTLDNTTNNLGTRVSDSATITVNGNSALNFTHAGAATTNYSETMDTLSLQSGMLTYTGSQAATGQTSNVQFSTLSRSGTATVNFSGTSLGVSGAEAGRNTIKFSGLADGDLGPWAVVNGDLVQDFSTSVGFARYDSTRGITVGPATTLDAAGSGVSTTHYTLLNNRTITASTNPSYKTLLIATTTARTLTTSGNNVSVGGISAAVAATTHTISGTGTLQTLNAGDDLYINVGSSSLTISSVIRNHNAGSTASGLVKFGAGTLLLNAANTFTGGTKLSAGTLTLSNAGALGSTSGQLSVNGGTLNMVANSLTVGNLTGSGGIISGTSGTRTLTIGQGDFGGGNFQGQINDGSGGTTALTKTGNGTITLSGANGYTAATIVSGGTLQLGNNTATGSLTGTSSITVTGATLSVNRNNAFTQATDLNNKAITGAGGFTQAGSGTTTLSLDNTYQGATAVNAGTLEISAGNINSSSGVTVAAGATFIYNSSTALTRGITNNGGTVGGVGKIGVAIVMDSTSDILAPGNSPGIQEYTVDQTWASFTYEWEVNDFTGTTAGTDFDQIAITGNLALTGAASGSYILDLISLTAGNAAGDVPSFLEITRTWNILTTTGTITGFEASYWTIDHSTGPNTFTSSPGWAGTWNLGLNDTNNALVLTYTAVPEPGAALLGSLGLLVLLRRRR